MLSHFARAAAGAGGGIELVGVVEASDYADPWSITITGIAFEAGDIGVLVFSASNGGAGTVGISPAMTSRYVNNLSTPYAGVYTRVMDGTETTISGNSSSSNQASTILFFVLRNAAFTAITTAASGSSGSPNPPSITSVVSSDWVVVTGHLGRDSVTQTMPSGYTEIAALAYDNGLGPDSTTLVGYATGLSGTVDPGSFTTDADAWRATTIRFSQE